MKSIFKTIRSIVCGSFRSLTVAALFAAAVAAHAQTPVMMVNQPLTNSIQFTLASGNTNIATATTAVIQSQPFYIWRGRGFTLTEAFQPATSSTSAITNLIQLATVINTPNGLVTNWVSTPTLTAIFYCNGTSRVVASTNYGPAQVDNYYLGRLLSIANGTSVTVGVDPTNTYTSVFP